MCHPNHGIHLCLTRFDPCICKLNHDFHPDLTHPVETHESFLKFCQDLSLQNWSKSQPSDRTSTISTVPTAAVPGPRWVWSCSAPAESAPPGPSCPCDAAASALWQLVGSAKWSYANGAMKWWLMEIYGDMVGTCWCYWCSTIKWWWYECYTIKW